MARWSRCSAFELAEHPHRPQGRAALAAPGGSYWRARHTRFSLPLHPSGPGGVQAALSADPYATNRDPRFVAERPRRVKAPNAPWVRQQHAKSPGLPRRRRRLGLQRGLPICAPKTRRCCRSWKSDAASWAPASRVALLPSGPWARSKLGMTELKRRTPELEQRRAHAPTGGSVEREAARALAELIERLGIKVPTSGAGSPRRSPSGWTWHHLPDKPGVMQLVQRRCIRVDPGDPSFTLAVWAASSCGLRTSKKERT